MLRIMMFIVGVALIVVCLGIVPVLGEDCWINNMVVRLVSR